ENQILRNFENIHSADLDPELLEIPKKLSTLLVSLSKSKNRGNHSDPLRHKLLGISEQILDTERGNFRAFGAGHCREFYKTVALPKAEKSIWTTNLPGTFGREAERSLIEAQKLAAKKTAS